MREVRTLMFIDYDSGEEFFVEVEKTADLKADIKKAYEEIWDYFADPSFIDEVSASDAEMMGLDVY